MNKKAGFSLIELILSLELFSILLTVFLKLNVLEHSRGQTILEEQNLMAYMDVLEWTLKTTRGSKVGIWCGFQDVTTKERKFIRGDIKEKVCSANVQIPEGQDFYQVDLIGETLQNTKIKPLTFFILDLD
ncbi:MAG: prepilin-type N-terminal cleavage/methylation domain-containing protein [bacterium]